MKYALFYHRGDKARAAELFPAHQALWKKYQAEGTLLMIGPFTPPAEPEAMGVFKTREAAEEFARSDPFVIHGVVGSWRILEWREALGDA